MTVAVCLFAGAAVLNGCAWKQTVYEGPVPAENIPELMKVFATFSEYLEAEQAAGREVSLEDAKIRGLGFLVDASWAFQASRVYTLRYREGYDALDAWLPKGLPFAHDLSKTQERGMFLFIGRQLRSPKDYEFLRYYEVSARKTEVSGRPLHEEAVVPRQRKDESFVKFKLIAMRGAVLDVRIWEDFSGIDEEMHENFIGRVGRFFADVIKMALGNSPANMAPTPRMQ